MRKVQLFILLLLSMSAMAQIHLEGQHYAIPGRGGVDSVYVVADMLTASVVYTGSEADANLHWKNYAGLTRMDGANELTTLDEGGYRLFSGDSLMATFYLIDYTAYAYHFASTDSLLVVPVCDGTTVQLKSGLKPMKYSDPVNNSYSVDRLLQVHYSNLTWGENGWEEQEQTADWPAATYANVVLNLPPCYAPTTMALTLDSFVLDWGRTVDTLRSEEMQPIAVSDTLQSKVNIRGSADMNNEVNGPTAEDMDLANPKGSAPLDVLFKSNPTPAVEYIRWSIYRGNELLATRSDENIRYTFMAPGMYSVKCVVYNGTCSSDTLEIPVAVGESKLLVPNVFTPNGDGVNDEFRVLYKSLKEYHIWVYNRWGKLVYESEDPQKGWDGMIGNRPAAVGAYFYVIRALGTDAESGYMNHMGYQQKKKKADPSLLGVYQLSGDINLLR